MITAIQKQIYGLMALVMMLLCLPVLAATATYTNPVIAEIGPADPTIILYNGKYYMYPTGDNTSYHVYTSSDLVNWQKGARVFVPGGINIWAPDVYYNEADKKFYLYYTADFKIGVAVADKPDGTFVNKGILFSGFIDAHVFRDDDGKLYMYYTDIGHMYVQEMETLLKMKGSRTMIFQPSQDWEKRWGSVNEGPWMIKHGGIYYLLYSGSGADSQYYAVGYATATNPLGPFTKYTGNPIVQSGNGVYGPGHGAVTRDAAGNLWHIYHQKQGTAVDWNRFICIDPLWFDSLGVLHGLATRGKSQPAPDMTPAAQTVAYWRFEEGPAGAPVKHGAGDGVFEAGAMDGSGQGNHLSAWTEAAWAGEVYRTAVPVATVPQNGLANSFCLQNGGTDPGLFTASSASKPAGVDLESWIPRQWTVEAWFQTTVTSGHRTMVGRDGTSVVTADAKLAPLYLKVEPDNTVSCSFADLDGGWHVARSTQIVAANQWYHLAAVSNGMRLTVYLDGQEVAGLDLGGGNTALAAGTNSGANWHAGGWSVFRGCWNGAHTDRWKGFLDEVRLTDGALSPEDFLRIDSRPAGVTAGPAGLIINEQGATAGTVNLALQYAPRAEVTLTVAEQGGRGQVTLNKQTLVFTSINWATPQPIVVRAVDDAALENARQTVRLTVQVASADSVYNGLSVEPLALTVLDNECGAWGYRQTDYNLDCLVNVDDLVCLATQWLDCTTPNLPGCVDYR